MNAFPNPDRPIVTCTAKRCDGCAVRDRIHCHFCARDLLHFLLICFPVLLVGGAGVLVVGAWALVPWAVIFVGFFGLIEIRVMCSHCPHYAEPGGTLQCWANYGAPRLWAYRPGPMSRAETTVFWIGIAAAFGYPLPFLVIGARWFLLALYGLLTVGGAMTMQVSMCARCMNFACPLNRVDQEAREAFFACNRGVAEAWRE